VYGAISDTEYNQLSDNMKQDLKEFSDCLKIGLEVAWVFERE